MNDPCPVAKRFALPYIAYHLDADRRTKRGQRQRYCKTCERWRWSDCLADCPVADSISKKEYERQNP